MPAKRRFESDTLPRLPGIVTSGWIDPERISEYEKCGADIEVVQLIY